MSPRRRSILLGGLVIAGASALAGALLSVVLAGASPAAALRGLVAGSAVAVSIYTLDAWLSASEFGRVLRRQAFPVVVAARTAGAAVVALVGLGLAATVIGDPLGAYVSPTTIAYALVAALAFNIVWQLNRILGPGALLNLVTGRYHHPRLEERVLLFMDLQGSTTTAESLGPVRFLGLLDQISFDVADPILASRGEIHRYVGDELIVTWPAARGLKNAASIRTAFAMLDAVAARGGAYAREFGFEPRFHVALHAGEVAVGQMGDIHRELVFLGDTVNTTARIEALSGSLGHAVLASDAVITGSGNLPTTISTQRVGATVLRGRTESIDLWALSRQ